MKHTVLITSLILLFSTAYAQFVPAKSGSIKINPNGGVEKTVAVDQDALDAIFPELEIESANEYVDGNGVKSLYGNILLSFLDFGAAKAETARAAYNCEQKSLITGAKNSAKKQIKDELRDKNLESSRHRVFKCTWTPYKVDDTSHGEEPSSLVIIAYGKGKYPHTVDLFPLGDFNYTSVHYDSFGTKEINGDEIGFDGEMLTVWNKEENISNVLAEQAKKYITEKEFENFDLSNYRIRLEPFKAGN